MSNISLQEQIELSQRTKILELIKEGKPQREIINIMGISRDTIKRRLGLRQDGINKVVINNYDDKKNKNLIVPVRSSTEQVSLLATSLVSANLTILNEEDGYDWEKEFEEIKNLWNYFFYKQIIFCNDLEMMKA